MSLRTGMSSTHRYWLALALALGALILGVVQRRALCDFFLGPYHADTHTLPNHCGRYITVSVEDSEASFFRAFTMGQPPYSWYAWLRIEGKWLLARLPSRTSGPLCTGLLQPATSYEQQYLLKPARADQGKEILPGCLDATRPFWMGTLFLVVLPLTILSGTVGLLLRKEKPLSGGGGEGPRGRGNRQGTGTGGSTSSAEGNQLTFSSPAEGEVLG